MVCLSMQRLAPPCFMIKSTTNIAGDTNLVGRLLRDCFIRKFS